MKRLGIDIGSTTVKVAVIDEEHNIYFRNTSVTLQISKRH